MRPTNMAEWSSYISTLAGPKLSSQTAAANSQAFSQQLMSEGVSMGEIEQIMLLFARQCRKVGVKIPENGPWDLVNLALTDTVGRQEPQLSEEEALFIQVDTPIIPDEMDDFELLAGFDEDE